MHAIQIRRVVVRLAVAAFVFTGCVGSDSAERNQQHLDAVNVVADRIHSLTGTAPSPGGVAVAQPCFGAAGEEIDRAAAGAGDLIESGYQQQFLDVLIAGFAELDDLRDEASSLADQTPTRETAFRTTVDGVEVSVVAWVAETGAFGWTATTSCSN